MFVPILMSVFILSIRVSECMHENGEMEEKTWYASIYDKCHSAFNLYNTIYRLKRSGLRLDNGFLWKDWVTSNRLSHHYISCTTYYIFIPSILRILSSTAKPVAWRILCGNNSNAHVFHKFCSFLKYWIYLCFYFLETAFFKIWNCPNASLTNNSS